MRNPSLCWMVVVVLAAVNEASASELIAGHTGDVEVLLTPPGDVRINVTMSNTKIRVFEETVSHALIEPLTVDFTAPGTYNQNDEPVPGVIPAGSVVNSHFIHFDTEDSTSGTLTGSIDFFVPILGVIFSDPTMPNGGTLNASDEELGAPGTLYPTSGGMGSEGRGWELGSIGEITLTAGRRTLRFDGRVEQALDQIRVITGNCSHEYTGPPVGGDCPTWHVLTADNLEFEGCDIVVSGCADVVIEGEHWFNSLTISSGVVRSEYGVPTALDITTDLVIGQNGSFDASGRGHPSEQGSGAGEGGGTWPCLGDEGGAGGGYGGSGGNGTTGAGGGVYGWVEEPADMGSGGGHSYGVPGGRGGGAIRLTVGGTLINNGLIAADGANSSGCDSGGGGSGGSIWIEASTIEGEGLVTADGGSAGLPAGGGGGGRIALHYDSDTSTRVVHATGGVNAANGARTGGAGTIYRKQFAESLGTMVIDNGGNAGAETKWTGDVASIHDITVSGAAAAVIEGEDWFDNFSIVSGGIVRSGFANPTVLNIATDLLIDAGARIDVSRRGHPQEQGPGAGEGGGSWPCLGDEGGAGGGYGGSGGNGTTGVGGGVYGSVEQPSDLGSGGGHSHHVPGGRGGGAIRLTVGGTLTNNGLIAANGENGPSGCDSGGGGSGGSIWIEALTIEGDGLGTVDGGSAGFPGGGGGGGRIAVYSCSNTSSWTLLADGGVNTANQNRSGEDGTVRTGPLTCAGDFGCDGNTDIDDFAILASCMAVPGQPASPGCEPTDLDGDGDVDLIDFAVFQAGFGCR